MNETEEIGPGEILRQRGVTLQDLATDKTLEAEFGHSDAIATLSIVDTAGEAWDGAVEYANSERGMTPYIRVDDGRVEIEWDDDGHVVYCFLSRESSTWKDVRSSYDSVIDDLYSTGRYQNGKLGIASAAIGAVAGDLKQGVSIEDHAEQIANTSLVTPDGNEAIDFSEYFSGESEWELANTVSANLEGWSGRASEMFRLAYANRLPAILVGQYVVAKLLDETLEVAETAFRGARLDGEDLAQAAIDALEASSGGDGIEVNWEEVFNVINQVAGLTAGATAFVPGAQGFAAAAGLIAASASAAAYVSKKIGSTDGAKAPKMRLESTTVEGIMGEVSSQSAKVHSKVEDVEIAAAEVLNEIYDFMMSSKPAGVSVYPNRDNTEGGGVELTVRQAFFEPKAPNAEKGYGPGLGTIGDDLRDDNPNNDPSYKDLKDPDVLGAPPVPGESLAAPLEAMWHAGHTQVPALADRYAAIAGGTSDAAEGVDTGFTRETLIAGGQQTGMGTGRLYPTWTKVHGELLSILNGSASNLYAVGETLAFAATAYAEHDDAAAAELRKRFDGELPWE